jgi:hypothetical protein
MSISQVLEAALGLALIYYLMGLVVSWMSKFVMETFETRGRTLEGYLKRIVGTKSLGQLLSMPQIRSLAPVRNQNWRKLFPWNIQAVEKKVEKVPVNNLVDAFFDLTQIDLAARTEDLIETVNQLPASEGKTELQRLINSGVTRASDLRAKMGLWLEGLMDQSAAMFKMYAQQFVLLFSLCLTLVLGVDSIDLFRQLWSSPDLRAIAAVKAQAYIDQKGYDADPDPLLTDLEQLTIRVGWASILKNAPPSDSLVEFVKFWLLKVIGLLITVVAVSQGAPFWYDILRKVSQAKSPSTNRAEENPANPPNPEPGVYG